MSNEMKLNFKIFNVMFFYKLITYLMHTRFSVHTHTPRLFNNEKLLSLQKYIIQYNKYYHFRNRPKMIFVRNDITA